MSGAPYGFYAATLRFVAAKLTEGDPRTAPMVVQLRAAARSFEADGVATIASGDLEVAARAFAGVAAFLQKEILPETVAHGHADAERQVRWTVDAAMEAVNLLLRAAALDGRPPVTLAPPPVP